MATVTVKEVRKTYGNQEVVHGVSANIADGEFVVLVGPSGCGKSTLLRMIAGLEAITAGTISIGGKVVNDMAPKERDISMVFQNYALYPHMTVAQNMAFSLTLAGAPAEEKKRKVAEAAEILGLSPLLDRYPRQLSGGQRQRVAMGRSIVRNPQVFLFDEPLSNLDAKLRVAMRAEIKGLHRRLRSTTVYVTHDQVEAMTMADKIVVLQSGKIEQIGSPLELYDRPANVFVAQFIGSPSMNILKAKKAGNELRLPDGSSLGVGPPASLRDGGDVLVGKRPEHIRGAEVGGLEVRTIVIEPTGAETFVQFTSAGGDIGALFRDRIDLQDDAPLRIDLAHGPIHFFEPESGNRIPVD